ncbi:antibiotic biosynthesis monooxygenase family protein [Naumannella cuiyingiana]|uniref:Quinol monooxygenase YgiN n=1 Tax=Naumannella cuiyingiana TaxID=1347891 RepID=A0A7Z0IJV2_9ACTN|nr:quinol monooxygenase YgiN [Naumannella cuiyingiana]
MINRFRVPDDREAEFGERMRAAIELLAGKPGCEAVDLVRNLDEPGLWALVGRWRDVGSYRRALNGYDSKMIIVPVLSLAIDEPSAYDEPQRVGENLPRIT